MRGHRRTYFHKPTWSGLRLRPRVCAACYRTKQHETARESKVIQSHRELGCEAAAGAAAHCFTANFPPKHRHHCYRKYVHRPHSRLLSLSSALCCLQLQVLCSSGTGSGQFVPPAPQTRDSCTDMGHGGGDVTRRWQLFCSTVISWEHHCVCGLSLTQMSLCGA